MRSLRYFCIFAVDARWRIIPPVGVVHTLSMLIFSRVCTRPVVGKPHACRVLAVLGPVRRVRDGSASTASTVAAPPTTMMPLPLPSESRFRLTRGWALMCPTFAALGWSRPSRPCRRRRTTPAAARAGPTSRPSSASRTYRTESRSETSCVNSTAMDANVVSRNDLEPHRR